jgi:RNA polymerase sigma factor (sigma-70 family)
MLNKTMAVCQKTQSSPRGDEPELFRCHHERLLRLVARDTGAPPPLAEDACCFAWLQLLRHQPERERIVGWLRVVARHEALRLQRQQWRTVPLDAPTVERREGQAGEPLTLTERLPAPVDTELAVEARDALRAVAGLRWRRRRVLELKLAGFRYREIMELLGVTYTNVNRHMTESRAELRSLREAA